MGLNCSTRTEAGAHRKRRFEAGCSSDADLDCIHHVESSIPNQSGLEYRLGEARLACPGLLGGGRMGK